jgi:hypothetical protein
VEEIHTASHDGPDPREGSGQNIAIMARLTIGNSIHCLLAMENKDPTTKLNNRTIATTTKPLKCHTLPLLSVLTSDNFA